MSTRLHEPPTPTIQGKAAGKPRQEGWRWQTSNSEYGKFYVAIHREFVKSREAHKDCSSKCDNLKNEIQIAKCQLEKLQISCGRNFCGPERNQDMSCAGLPTSPKLGNCRCPGRPEPPSGDMYVTEMMNQFNGAQRQNPQLLLDHIKDDHPHLVKRLKPKVASSAPDPVKKQNDSGNEDDGCYPHGMGSGSAPGLRPQSPRSRRGRGSDAKRKSSPRPGRAPKKHRATIYEAVSDLKHTAGGGVNLPATQRYDFYRYYGYAGQGAKTSKEWHSRKSPWNPKLQTRWD